jgi:hypothetical protein
MIPFASPALRLASLFVATLLLAACSPALDWREVRPGDAGLALLFPCKPAVQTRAEPAPAASSPGAGPQALGLAVCQAADISFSLAWAEVGDPTQLGPALREMRTSLLARLQAQAGPAQALAMAGMTPSDEAQQQSFETLSGGQLREGRVAVFARGLRIYQLVLLGARAGAAAQPWDSFVGGVRLVP